MPVPNARLPVTEFWYYITPDGVTYSLHSPPNKTVLSFTGTGHPDAVLSRSQGPYEHGETPSSIRLNTRTLSMTIRHNDCNRSNYWTTRANLLSTLKVNRTDLNNPSPGTLRFIRFNNGVRTVRDLKVFFISGLIFEPSQLGRWDEFSIQETLTFEALDPVWFDPTLQTVTIDTFTASLILPMTFPFTLGTYYADQDITYLGTWFSYPTIVITGPAFDFGVINNTIDQRIALDYAISSGEIVTINLDYNTKSVTNNFGDNLISKVTSNSSLDNFILESDPLAANGLNELTIYLNGYTGDTSVDIQYYKRYEGM